ncbi:MAG: signal recognition particle-docking protein FtsY [Ignavibacteria bacterium]|nr:signal recognition particle-docking protein FtsY [Ignavibacteria bacterium]
MGLFSRLKEGLAKTRDTIVQQVKNIIQTKSTIDDELLVQLEEILLSADVGIDATERIIEGLRLRIKEVGYKTTNDVFILLNDELQKVFINETSNPISNQEKIRVVMIVGVNGVGKTTTIGKLAYNFTQDGKKVLIAAADTFRAAANEQLAIWAERAGVNIIQQAQGADPAAVAFDALQSAIAKNIDVLLVDTAGRLHTKTNLMEELKKISRVMKKLMPEAPHDVWLVLDATTGQNAIQQAKQFSLAIDVNGLILTKLDGTAKGGVVIAIHQTLKIPIKYIGVGERIDDLQQFDANQFINALVGTEYTP